MEQDVKALLDYHRKRLARLQSDRLRFGPNTPAIQLQLLDDEINGLEAEIKRLEKSQTGEDITESGVSVVGDLWVSSVKGPIHVGGQQYHGDQVGGDKVVHSGTAVAAGSVTGVVVGDLSTKGDVVRISPSTADVDELLAPIFSAINQLPAQDQAEAKRLALNFRNQLLLGRDGDDSRLAGLIDGLAAQVPGAVSPIVSMFASPQLSGVPGPVCKYVLAKLQPR